jgi:hypothetical protein
MRGLQWKYGYLGALGFSLQLCYLCQNNFYYLHLSNKIQCFRITERSELMSTIEKIINTRIKTNNSVPDSAQNCHERIYNVSGVIFLNTAKTLTILNKNLQFLTKFPNHIISFFMTKRVQFDNLKIRQFENVRGMEGGSVGDGTRTSPRFLFCVARRQTFAPFAHASRMLSGPALKWELPTPGHYHRRRWRGKHYHIITSAYYLSI